jgi:hypothetical protein
MIWLFSPILLHEFQAAAIDYLKLIVVNPEQDQCRPTRMCF